MSRKLIFAALVVLVASGLFWGYYQYSRGHEDLGTKEPAFTLRAPELIQAFTKDEAGANQMYVGKVIQVSGTVVQSSDQKESQIITLQGNEMGGILCAMAEKIPEVIPGQEITLRGECTGALGDTDLGLLDVNMVRCVKK